MLKMHLCELEEKMNVKKHKQKWEYFIKKIWVVCQNSCHTAGVQQSSI